MPYPGGPFCVYKTSGFISILQMSSVAVIFAEYQTTPKPSGLKRTLTYFTHQSAIMGSAWQGWPSLLHAALVGVTQ